MADDERAVWERLIRYQRITLGTMDEHLRDRFDCTLDQYDVMHQLASAGEPLRMGALAERLLVANSSCTNIVGALERRQFVERRPVAGDGRAVEVALTAEGRRTYRRLAALHGRDISTLFADRLHADQLAALDGIVRRLLDDT